METNHSSSSRVSFERISSAEENNRGDVIGYNVLRIYHGGRDAAHRARDRALVAAGHRVTLVMPTSWPEAELVHDEPFELVPLAVRRPGDVNRHVFADARALADVVRQVRPDVVDVHEEPFSAVTAQVLRTLGPGLPVVAYTAQNIDKRWPPPFAGHETRAYARLAGLHPCSSQAASVARGKGFRGRIDVIPLGVDAGLFTPGGQTADDAVFTLGVVGRLVEWKGVVDAVLAASAVRRVRRTRLLVVGDGPERTHVLALAASHGVDVEYHPWVEAAELAELYRRMHVVLVPSRATRTWVEQFGRVVPEARRCGAVVVATTCGSLPGVVGATGVLVSEGSVAELAAAVCGLALDGGRWAQLRHAGLEVDATWDDVAVAVGASYAHAVAGDRADHAVGRPAAVAEFGPPATVTGGGRPFALPVLREDTRATRLLARTVDSVLAR